MPANYRTNAFTLIELLVVLGIVSLLAGLLLPAVQSARESSRRLSCQNNAKQIALATTNFEAARKKLPHTVFSEFPQGQLYKSDQGILTSLLPFLEEQNRASALNGNSLTYQPQNQFALKSCPSVFRCPSISTSAKFSDLPVGFSTSNTLRDLETSTCDYAISSGIAPLADDYKASLGAAGLSIPAVITAPNSATIVDGLSNTLGGWECRGDVMRMSSGETFVFSTAVPDRIYIHLSHTHRLEGLNTATSKAWAYGWAGHRVGQLHCFTRDGNLQAWTEDVSGAVLNVTNHANGPIGLHKQGVNTWRLDGSVHFTSESISPGVMRSLVTIQGGD